MDPPGVNLQDSASPWCSPLHTRKSPGFPCQTIGNTLSVMNRVSGQKLESETHLFTSWSFYTKTTLSYYFSNS